MFKKALFAVAVAGTFAGAASAADVKLYGVVDYGMMYVNNDVTHFGANDENLYQGGDSVTMESGMNSATRFGLYGTENLGNGFKLSFNLENAVTGDDGKLAEEDRLFQREARLTIENERFGEISFGRMGGLGSAYGYYDTTFMIADAFDGGSQNIVGMAMSQRVDNSVVYRSPKIAGLQATAQYSFDADTAVTHSVNGVKIHGEEGHATVDRYAGFALTGEYGNLQAVASYEQIMYSSLEEAKSDTKIASVGGNYDFGIAKLFAMGQYFEGVRFLNVHGLDYDPILAAGFSFPEGADGSAFALGTQASINGGFFSAALYYNDFKVNVVEGKSSLDTDGTFVGAAAQYIYPLSSSTELYAGMGYGLETIDRFGTQKRDYEIETTQAFAGITHYF